MKSKKIASRGRSCTIVVALAAITMMMTPGAQARWPGAVALPATNDNFADAKLITALPYHDEVDARHATDEEGEPGCEDRSIWYRIDVDQTTDFTLTIDTHEAAIVDGSYYVGLSVLRGEQLGSLYQIECEYLYNGQVGFTAFPEHTYYIRIAGAYGPVTLDVEAATNALRGKLSDEAGAPLVAECVRAVPVGSSYAISVQMTDELGRYSYANVPPGDYQVQFGCGSTYAAEWYDDVVDREHATVLNVPAVGVIDGIDGVLARSGRLSGKVFDSEGGTPQWLCVQLSDAVTGKPRGFDYTDTAGAWAMNIYDSGSFKLEFGCDWADAYVNEWYDEAPSFEEADPIELQLGEIRVIPDEVVTVHPKPVNDTFASSLAITDLPFRATQDVTRATLDPGEEATCQYVSFDKSIWYSVTPDASGSVIASTTASRTRDEFMTEVLITDESGALQSLGCDIHGQFPETPSAVAFDVQEGRTYHIRVAAVRYVPELTVNVGWATDANDFTFEMAVPCGYLCGYSTNEYALDSLCRPRTKTATSSFSDLSVEVPSTLSDGRAPASMLVDAFPEGDWDIFACRATPDSSGRYFLAWSANAIDDPCDPVILGCEERLAISVTPGEQIVLRAYNWADAQPTPARYAFASEGAQ